MIRLTLAAAAGGLALAAAMPALAQEGSFEDAFGGQDSAETPAEDAAAPVPAIETHDETVGDWRVFDGATTQGERRVFMHKDLGSPDRYVEFQENPGGRGLIAFHDTEGGCDTTIDFDMAELGLNRAAGLHAKFADMLDEDACAARDAVPSAEELAAPLAKIDEYLAARPFPAAGYWRWEERILKLGDGLGEGVVRYAGKVAVIFLEPKAGARGPDQVTLSIVDCPDFSEDTQPVESGDPAEAQEIALHMLQDHAEACGLSPDDPARISDGLAEGFAQRKAENAAEPDDAEPSDAAPIEDAPPPPSAYDTDTAPAAPTGT
jgi:hypothetical protein